MHAIAVVTLFPQFVETVGTCGVTGRAVDNGLLALTTVNPRQHSTDRHRTVDDRPYGGGPGMVMQAPPLLASIKDAKAQNGLTTDAAPIVVYVSPQGQRLDHSLVLELAACRNLVLIAGRYEGIDERVIEMAVDREISIGDYVLSGGELASMVIIDALARQVPGVLGHAESVTQDSFYGEGLLDHPHFTRPEVIGEQRVPSVLTGGDHAKIARWRRQQALGRTWLRRPDLLEQIELSADDQRLLAAFRAAHNEHG